MAKRNNNSHSLISSLMQRVVKPTNKLSSYVWLCAAVATLRSHYIVQVCCFVRHERAVESIRAHVIQQRSMENYESNGRYFASIFTRDSSDRINFNHKRVHLLLRSISNKYLESQLKIRRQSKFQGIKYFSLEISIAFRIFIKVLKLSRQNRLKLKLGQA